MALFKKKKKKEEEEDDEVDSSEKGEKIPPSLRRKRIEDKEFKDLKAENKRKRKEPPKPWGKKERLFVLAALLVTAGGSGFLALSSREWKLGGLPRIESPKIEAPFLGEEKIIIEGKQKDKNRADSVIETFNQTTANLTGVYGLYVVRLKNGFSYGVNAKETFTAASLIKLPVMAAMFAEAEKGNLELDEKYTLQAGDKVEGSGSLYGKPVGYEITYRNILQLMGKQSDNTAFRIARKTLGDATINSYMQRYGMVHTSLSENETTPEDVGMFFEGLWNNNIISDRHKDELLDSLTGTIYEAWLPAGLPIDVRIAHKYGREVHVINDAGIVFTSDPYVVVVMSKGIVDAEGDQVFPELSSIVYNGESS
jgi:beta-lactamase class A